jgi:hypothetical protein
MTPEQIRKDLNDTSIHVYSDGEKVTCELQGNSLLLLAMIDQALTEIVDKNGVSYDQAISALELLHKNQRRVNDTVINKILGDL